MDWTLEVVVLRSATSTARSRLPRPGRLPPRSRHAERVHARHPADPTRLRCSIVFGDLPPHKAIEPGSMTNFQLVVSDAPAARQELLDRGIEVSALTVINDADGGTFFGFQDPDGKPWQCRNQSPSSQAAHSGGPHRSQRRGRSLILRRTPPFPSRRDLARPDQRPATRACRTAFPHVTGGSSV